jgi:hypothetical protein
MSAHPPPLPNPPPPPPLPPYHPPPPFHPYAHPYPQPFLFPGYYSHGATGIWPPPPISTQPNLPCHQPPPTQTTKISPPQKQPSLTPPNTHHKPQEPPTKQPKLPSQHQQTAPLPKKPHHNQEPPKPPNTVHIDNKFFQISWGGGRAYPFCITERKFKTTLGKIWLGVNDMVWLGNTIEKAASKDTVGDFFRHH